MEMNVLEMSTGVRIIPVNAERMLNGSHGYPNAEFDKWVQFKFTDISESLAQVWTGIPFQYISRLEELNDGRPVRNYALKQLAQALLQNTPGFDPTKDYIYICHDEV
ncbi:MAG TPA: hypothetical protein VI731_02065 [Bacteroidia bacterium]|nr:hypothetical protein [Bacteroidia bacterium]